MDLLLRPSQRPLGCRPTVALHATSRAFEAEDDAENQIDDVVDDDEFEVVAAAAEALTSRLMCVRPLRLLVGAALLEEVECSPGGILSESDRLAKQAQALFGTAPTYVPMFHMSY